MGHYGLRGPVLVVVLRDGANVGYYNVISALITVTDAVHEANNELSCDGFDGG
jgi:hypothetical protein